MSAIGIPVAYGFGNLFEDETKMLAYLRDITMVVSASIILKRCHYRIKADEKDLGGRMPLLFSRQGKQNMQTSNILNQDLENHDSNSLQDVSEITDLKLRQKGRSFCVMM